MTKSMRIQIHNPAIANMIALKAKERGVSPTQYLIELAIGDTKDDSKLSTTQ